MRKIFTVIPVAAVLFLAGCSGLKMREDTAKPPASDWQVTYDTQVAIGDCVFSTEGESAALTAIGGALLSSAISQGVNYLGTALDEAAKEKEVGVLASRNVEVNQNSFGPCVHLVRGWFYLDPAKDDKKLKEAGKWFKSSKPDKTVVDESKLKLYFDNQLWLAAYPDFVFEGRLQVANSDKTALTLIPQYVALNEPLFTRQFRDDRERHVSLFFAFAEATETLSLPDKAAASIVVGKLEPGKPKIYPLPKIDSEDQINRWPNEADWFTLALPEGKKPLTIGGYLQEKQGASAHLKFIAAVFGGAKDDITAALQTALVPSKKAEAAEAQKTAAEQAADGYDTALVKAIDDLEKCVASGDAATAAAARSAMRGLNSAARGFNKSKPFSNDKIEAIKVTGASSDKIQQACKSAGDSIK